MRIAHYAGYGVLLGVLCLGPGCARGARDTAGFGLENSVTLDAPLDRSWQVVKTVLREKEFEIYIRDKRGAFIAYTRPGNQYLNIISPRRVQYTVELAPLSEGQTRLYIETVRQVYGSTLLTYPDWHDRKTSDVRETQAILEAVQAKVAGAPVTTSTPTAPS